MARLAYPVFLLAEPAGFPFANFGGTYFLWEAPAPEPLAAPVVRNVSPEVGSSVRAVDTLTFEVYAANGLERAVISAQYDGILLREIVHDGFGFGPAYQNALCKAEAITGGTRFTLWRTGGWPASMTLLVIAYDSYALEYAGTKSWTLVGGPLGETPAVG